MKKVYIKYCDSEILESDFWTNGQYVEPCVLLRRGACQILMPVESKDCIEEMRHAKNTVINFGPSEMMSGRHAYLVMCLNEKGKLLYHSATSTGTDEGGITCLNAGKMIDLRVWLPDGETRNGAHKSRCVLRTKAPLMFSEMP